MPLIYIFYCVIIIISISGLFVFREQGKNVLIEHDLIFGIVNFIILVNYF